MIVKIDKLSHDFRGITRVNDKVTFVSDTIPGEVVDVRVISSKKNMDEAKVISYIDISDDRVKPRCPYYELCGGCDTSFIKYEKVLKYKRDIVIELMERYADIMVNPDIIYDNNEYCYRNKISLKVKDGKLALNKESSSELVNIERCMLVNNNINSVIELFKDVDLSGAWEVIIRGTNEIMVIVNGDIDKDILINALNNSVSSIILNDKVIFGNDYITINIDNYKYAVYPKSFFQINTNMISKLYGKVRDYAGTGNKLLDLYCGAGTIGIYLSDNFKYVDGVEINSDAIDGANLNKKINNIDNINFECKSARDITNTNYDVIVVDPPRAGLDGTTINKLLDSNVKRIVYVSCNPITLARDIKLLRDKYMLEDITLFDMFPNTKHVECVVKLIKKED